MTSHPFVQVAVLSTGGPPNERGPLYTYHLPDELTERVAEGCLVVVPFGTRRLYGIVVNRVDGSPLPTKPIEALVDSQPVVTPQQIALAQWISTEYLAPLSACLELFLPPGLVGHADAVWTLRPDAPADAARTPVQAALLALLAERGPLRGQQIQAALEGEWRSAAEQLRRRGIIERKPFLAPPRAHPKHVRTVQIVPTAEIEDALAGLHSPIYQSIVEFLRREAAPVDVSWVYAETGCTRYHLDKLAERGVVAFGTEEVWRDPLAGQVYMPTDPPPLTPDQEAVWQRIFPSVQGETPQFAVYLLHGVTGSGKTEIYLRAVAEALKRGRRAVCLVPEIALTPQTVARFAARFPGRIAVLHSALTDGERYDTWRRARAGLVDVVIGPRSALFAPLASLGLIILDEEHDASYKQDAPVPRYHAREVALELARMTGATVILGSATPSLESFYRARRGEFQLLELPRRILGHARRLDDLQARVHRSQTAYQRLDGEPALQACYRPLPTVQVVDLRAELRAGNRSIFSRALQRALDEALNRGEQAILFLNRRGSATFVVCRECGYVVRCFECQIPMTYHGARAQLVCHHCNARRPQPERCPACKGDQIRYFGLGTEQVEQAVRERWPEARVLRWDADTARSPAAHTAILQHFLDGSADILIGTQMVAKGLDLPLVTVVGVISADVALNLPDFRASERAFQILTQVTGRAGRGLLNGQVIIQTYQPDHYAILAAANHDYAGFAMRELGFRREMGYPPYGRLTRLLYEDTDSLRARRTAQRVAHILRDVLARQGLPASDLIGPAPAFFARIRGRYRWQILLRHPRPAELLRSVRLPDGWQVDVDPVSVL